MQPLYLKSEDALCGYLKKFLAGKPNAVQLDGSTQPKANPGVWVIFTYSLTGKKYKLQGGLSRKAVEAFLKLAEEHGDVGAILKESSDPKEGLILANPQANLGWVCKPYIEKASNRFKKAS